MDEHLIHETPHTTIHQAEGYRVPGYLIVEPRSACTRIGELSAAAAADFFQCLTWAERLVDRLVEPDRLYILKFGEEKAQVHFHVFPRTERLRAAYLAAEDDAAPVSGARLVHWTWQHHAELGHSAEELAAFVTRARELTREEAGGARS